MKFDLLYELQMPKPHDDGSERRCYQEALEQIVLADRLGYDTVWFVEHHFLTEFAHSSAPEVFLGALSQATTRIRLGHGVTLLPHQFNHPIRVAERVAALDILSNGRVEFGTGRSSQYDRVGAFTIVHVADTMEQAVTNGGADAAINYLLYAFRVLGGFSDPRRTSAPSRTSTRRTWSSSATSTTASARSSATPRLASTTCSRSCSATASPTTPCSAPSSSSPRRSRPASAETSR